MTNTATPADAAPRGYWAGVREQGFALPHCADCNRYHFYPKPACPHCGSERVAPSRASGRGEVYSFSVVHRAPGDAFAGLVPYVVAIVATAEGPHLMTRLIDVATHDVRIGMPVRARPTDDGAPPLFEPVEETP